MLHKTQLLLLHNLIGLAGNKAQELCLTGWGTGARKWGKCTWDLELLERKEAEWGDGEFASIVRQPGGLSEASCYSALLGHTKQETSAVTCSKPKLLKDSESE